ncbi:MAG: hypothetical protein ACLQGP_30230 [Isosphaeraceae bacterium]
MRTLRLSVWFSLAIGLLSVVLYVGYSVAVTLAATLSEALAGIGVAAILFVGSAAFTALSFLAMDFLSDPIEFLLALLRFLLLMLG